MGEIICHLNLWRTVWCNHSKETSLAEVLYSAVKLCLIQTPHYYRQFALSLEKESLYIFSKSTRLIRTSLFQASRLSGSLNWRKRKHENKTGGKLKKKLETSSFFPPRQLFACLFLSLLPHFLRAWNRLNTDTLLIRTLSKVPSGSVLTRFD